jgi:alpha-aminoadipate carrier protein LysW
MGQIACIECDGGVPVAADVVAGEIVECPECGAELEIASTDPLSFQLAPEVAEDWGE